MTLSHAKAIVRAREKDLGTYSTGQLYAVLERPLDRADVIAVRRVLARKNLFIPHRRQVARPLTGWIETVKSPKEAP